eukprot:6435493-Pyramimonas_sp.AAC.1
MFTRAHHTRMPAHVSREDTNLAVFPLDPVPYQLIPKQQRARSPSRHCPACERTGEEKSRP